MEHSENMAPKGDLIHSDENPRDGRRGMAFKLRLSLGILAFLVWAGLICDLTLYSFLPENLVVALLLWRLLFPVLVTVWCFLDGRVLGKEPSELGLLGIFIAPPAGYVVYCFWSRGAGGFLPVFIALLPVIAVVVALATVGTIVPAIQ